LSVRKSKALACQLLRGKKSHTRAIRQHGTGLCLCTRQIINRAECQACAPSFDQEKPLIIDGFRLIPIAPFIWGLVVRSAAQEAAPK
ncbi:hypothetical protein QBC45DRAFT_339954, partial [Copromyces sp. CBS 386.78]